MITRRNHCWFHECFELAHLLRLLLPLLPGGDPHIVLLWEALAISVWRRKPVALVKVDKLLFVAAEIVSIDTGSGAALIRAVLGLLMLTAVAFAYASVVQVVSGRSWSLLESN